MAHQLEQQLFEEGKKLQHPQLSKDVLLKILKQVASYLSEVDQSPSEMMLKAMRPSLSALVTPELLRHQDRDVSLMVASCISEITRITAPDAPYRDDVLRDIFHLIVETFRGLDELNSPLFERRVTILETVAKIRSCVVMLDLECDDLILEMFRILFSVISDDHPEYVRASIQTIMTLVLDESEDISEQLLTILLDALGREKRDSSPAARRLAMNVLEHCAVKLEPYVNHFLISAMSGNFQSNLHTDFREIVYDIYQCAPQMLQALIPSMTQELQADQLDVRLKSVKLLGRLFALPGHPISEIFRPLFSEFLKRFTDNAVDVRLSVVEHAKECLLSNPFRHEASDILSALSDRLLDFDENVRKQAVAAICDVANYALKSIPNETIRLVAECLGDKMDSVREYTLERIADVYRVYCLKCADGSISDYEFEWIPGKILRCCYVKDFRPQAIELVFSESLFPSELSVVERVKHWIAMFSEFAKIEVKAFEGVLAQKQRLQQEMQNYLLLQQKLKDDDAPEFQKRIGSCFKTMSESFIDPAKAEESFQKLNQMKDDNIWKALASLLDPKMTSVQAQATSANLLKRLGEEHPQYEFVKILATKCSYLLFGKEHVKEMFKEITVNKLAWKDDLIVSSMNLLVLFAGFFPLLVEGAEEYLLQLLKEDNERIKEGIVHILAKAGGSIQEQMTESTSSVDLLLETVCLEGGRKQAKYAVQALATITKDAGLKALSVLYKRLVDMLESGTHLPTILQSLGCIAQNAMPVFETREEDVVQFVYHNLLRRSSSSSDVSRTEWEERSKECLLKIYGIKTLVKSYLPNKDAHLRQGLKSLLGILAKLLTSGEISEEVESSGVDKAHLRLAAAKAILRLSRQWDSQITPELFLLTLRIAQDSYPEVRKEFLAKVHQYLKENTLDRKYACAFVLSVLGVTECGLAEARQYLADLIEMAHREVQLEQPSVQSDGTLETSCPEYVLAYLVYVLAHHPEFPIVSEGSPAEAFESFYWQLHLFLSVLVHQGGDGNCDQGNKRQQHIAAVIMAIFQSIKHAEDAVDKSKSENLYTLCDLGLSITKDLVRSQVDPGDFTGTISLPALLYKPYDEESKGNDLKVEGSHLPACLASGDVVALFQVSNLYHVGHVTPDLKQLEKGVDVSVPEESDKEDSEPSLQKIMRGIKAQGSKKQNHLGDAKLFDTVNLQKGSRRETSNKSLGLADKLFDSKGLESNKPSDQVSNGRKDMTSDDVQKQVEIDDDNLIGNYMKLLISPKRKRGQTSKETRESAAPVEKRARSEDVTGGSESSQLKREGLKDSDVKEESKLDHSSMQTTEGVPTGVSGAASISSKLSPNNQEVEPSKASVLELSGLDAGNENSSKTMLKSQPGRQKVSREEDTPDASQEAGHWNKKKPATLPESVERSLSGGKKSSKGAVRKPLNTKSISVLEKIPSEKVETQNLDYENLAGRRIKVWWPLDKQFYEGIVQSYDSIRKKHKILYDDGDIEILKLQKERWEMIDGNSVPETLVPASVGRSKFAGATTSKKRIDAFDTIKFEEKKMQSPQKRRVSFSKVAKRNIPQSHAKFDGNDELAKDTEVNSSGVKIGEHFMHMDNNDRLADHNGGKVKLGCEGKKDTVFAVSTKMTSETGNDTIETRNTELEEKRGSLSELGSWDSDDEPLNAWRSRTGKLR